MENQSLGKVQIIRGTPPAQPGKCVMCGTTDGVFIDIGFEIDYYGVVYFCFGVCFVEIANVLGYYSPEQVEQIKHTYEELVKVNASLIEEITVLKNALDSITNVRDFCYSLVPANVAELETEPEPVATTPEPIDTRESEFEKSEPGSDESTNESGPANVRDDDFLAEIIGDI